VRMPTHDFGHRAARLLVGADGTSDGAVDALEPQLIVRGSCSVPPGQARGHA
jgi:hypothetical protein